MEKTPSFVSCRVGSRACGYLTVCLLASLLLHNPPALAARKKAARPPHHAVIEPRIEAADITGIQSVSGGSAGKLSAGKAHKAASRSGKGSKGFRAPRHGEPIELRLVDSSGREQVMKGYRLRGPRISKDRTGTSQARAEDTRAVSSGRVIRMQLQ